VKNLYRITNKQGATVCFQVAASAASALDMARMYQRGCWHAEFVRED
jgi:hypothetical protein